jgi:hypothetical protein
VVAFPRFVTENPEYDASDRKSPEVLWTEAGRSMTFEFDESGFSMAWPVKVARRVIQL